MLHFIQSNLNMFTTYWRCASDLRLLVRLHSLYLPYSYTKDLQNVPCYKGLMTTHTLIAASPFRLWLLHEV